MRPITRSELTSAQWGSDPTVGKMVERGVGSRVGLARRAQVTSLEEALPTTLSGLVS